MDSLLYSTGIVAVHYYNYNAGRYYNDDYPRTRFMSEYGYQSWPSLSSLKPLTESADWHEYSNFSLYRNHHGSGRCASCRIHAQAHVCAYARMCTCVRTHVYVCAHACVCVCAHVCMTSCSVIISVNSSSYQLF